MSEITQRLGFDATKALRAMDFFKLRLDKLNKALVFFNSQAGNTGGRTNVKIMEELAREIKKANDQTKKMTLSWETMFRVAQTQVLLGGMNKLNQAMREGVEAARELGIAIAEVQTIGSDMEMSNQEITQSIIDMSNEIGKAPLDLAEGLYQTLSNQVVEAGNALNFTSEAAKLATITGAQTADAINALSSVMNSYGLEAGEAVRVSDTLFTTIEVGRLRLSEIGNVLGRVTPLTAQLGIKWEEVAATLATMTRQGVRADTALTQMRAIVQQLIRPSEKLQEIFARWGVEDATDAIATFGGFPELMNKLAQETGGSSEELAELLRRVRAIAGFYGTMADEGNELTKSLDAISASAGRAAEEWRKFTETDAQKLTRSTQEFKNQFAEFGTKILPLVNYAIEGINLSIRNFVQNVRVLARQVDLSDHLANTLKDNLQEASEEVKRLNKIASQPPDYTKATQAARQYYSELEKEENALRAIREASIERAGDVLKAQSKDISNVYSQSIRDLQKFIDQANKSLIDSTKNVADIRQSIEDRRLQNELDAARNSYQERQILERALSKAKADANKKFAEVGADKETVENFKEASERVIDLSERLKDTVPTQRDRDSLEQSILRQMNEQIKAEERHQKTIKDTNKAVGAEYEERLKNEKRLQELLKESAAIRAGDDIQSKDEGVREGAEKQLKAIETEIAEIFASAENGTKFLESLGLDKTFNTLTLGLTQSMNDAHKDWAAEVARAQAAFDEQVIDIKAKIQPFGEIDRAGEALGVEREGKSESQFAKDVAAEAAETLTKNFQEQLEIQKANVDLNAKLKTAVQGQIAAFAPYNAALRQAGEVWREMYRLNSDNVTKAGEELEYRKGINNAMERSPLNALAAKYAEIINLFKAGKEVTQEQIDKLREETEATETNKQFTQEKKDLALNVLNVLSDTVKAQEAVNTAEAKAQPEEKVKAAKQHHQYLKNNEGLFKSMTTSSTTVKDATNQAATATSTMGTNMGNAAAATANTANSMTTSAEASTVLNEGMVASTGAISAAIVPASRLADELERAARAAAAAGAGGATAYHGAHMRYFADGGPTRGQDTIPTMLSAGETVINSKNSRRFFSELNAMNQGSQPVYREQGGPVTNVGDVNVTVNGGDSSQQTVREIGSALRREIQRGNIKLR